VMDFLEDVLHLSRKQDNLSYLTSCFPSTLSVFLLSFFVLV
jgi:hypothetical protein